jgi:beta-glucosidase
MTLTIKTSDEGITYRDLNGNGRMDPYENPALTTGERVADLLSRLSLEEKAGLMFQTVIEAGRDGSLLERPGSISKSPTSDVVVGKRMNHFNVHHLENATVAARWNNKLQRLAEQTPHGIPVTVSTDPRHAFIQNSGVSFAAGSFSQWPEPIGFAAIGDVERVREFADIARTEYRAVGIRAALHPTVDLATEPRWARQAGTFGQDSATASAFVSAYLDGFQGDRLGPDSVACTTKHFPGGGPQKDGEDAHFPYGREQVYPGGRFEEHLAPFRTAIAHGTAGIMPYYGMPVGLEIDGEPIDEVGFGYNRQIIQGLLREKLGYDGVVLTDWELVNDNWVDGQVLPARAWGVEHLDAKGRMEKILAAGADQFGGEECPELLLELIAEGRISEERINASARRLLTVKFELGLFDDPYVDEEAAAHIVGSDDFRRAGLRAQSESITVLENDRATLPLAPGIRLYVEGVDREVAARYCTLVDSPEDADAGLVRVNAPSESRNDLFLESWFHHGSLEFPPGRVYQLVQLARRVPLVLDVCLDRPAVLTPFAGKVAALTGNYGACDEALLDALTGRVTPRGRLPFQLPASMESVRRSREDVPSDADALYEFGHGLTIRHKPTAG